MSVQEWTLELEETEHEFFEKESFYRLRFGFAGNNGVVQRGLGRRCQPKPVMCLTMSRRLLLLSAVSVWSGLLIRQLSARLI